MLFIRPLGFLHEEEVQANIAVRIVVDVPCNG